MRRWYTRHRRALAGGILAAFAVFFVAWQAGAAIQSFSGYIWSGTIGYIDTAPSPANGLKLDSVTGAITGWAWSEHIGWIQFGGLSGFPTGSGTTPSNAIKQGDGDVVGWARACKGSASGDCAGAGRTDGWDGWIALTGSSFGVDLSGSSLSGYAWGGEVVGWVDFSGASLSCVVTQPQCSADGTKLLSWVNSQCEPQAERPCPNGCVMTVDGIGQCNPTAICLSVSPTTCRNTAQIRRGDTVTFYWDAPEGYSCRIFANGTVQGPIITTETYTTLPLNDPTNFRLSCAKAESATLTATAVINITPVFQEV